jgi:anti-sigma B factor antagonist
MAREDAHPTAVPAAVEIEFPEPGIACVRLRGEHDLASKQPLTEALTAAAAHPHVFVDLSECTFMDSSVVATLIVTHRDLGQRGGRLGLVIPPEARAIRRVAEITALAAVLPIHETPTAAVASFRVVS